MGRAPAPEEGEGLYPSPPASSAGGLLARWPLRGREAAMSPGGSHTTWSCSPGLASKLQRIAAKLGVTFQGLS